MRLFLYSLTDPLHLDARFVRDAPHSGGGAPLPCGPHHSGALFGPRRPLALARFWAYRAKYAMHRVRIPRTAFPRLLPEMARTHALLPLDADAAAQTAALNLDFRLPGDFLRDDDLEKMRRNRDDVLNSLWRDFAWREHWSANWLRDDSNMLLLAVSTSVFAEALADRFAELGPEEIVYFRPPDFRQGRGTMPNDYLPSVLERRFPGIARPVVCSSLLPSPAPAHEGDLPPVPPNSILFAFISVEARRHLPLVRAAVKACKRPVAVCFSDFLNARNNYEAVRRMYAPLDVPVLVLPSAAPSPRPKEAEERLRECAHAGMPRADGVDFFWRHCARERWPLFEAQLETWRTLFRNIRPAVCIGSTHHSPESSIPMKAAQGMGIPTVGVPHAFGYQLCSWDHLDYMDSLACCTRIQETFLAQSGAAGHAGEEDGKTISFPEVNLENQHAFKVRKIRKGRDKIVLFLHSGCQHGGWHLDPWRTVLLLREIGAAVPESLRGNVRMLHKVHPAMNEFGVQILAGVPAKDILYHKAHLATILEEADVAVAVNYTRAPLLHAMSAGRPTVFLRDRRQRGMYHPRDLTMARMMEERNFLTADGAATLWNTVERLLSDADWRRTVVDRQDAFCREQLGQSGSGWEAWLEDRILRAGTAEVPA